MRRILRKNEEEIKKNLLYVFRALKKIYALFSCNVILQVFLEHDHGC